MKIISKPSELKKELKNSSASIGFVPTMGALHNGHLALIKKSKEDNDLTVVSIFVNPTQFNDSNDYKNYPITHSADIMHLSSLKVDILFTPTKHDIYPDNYSYKIEENNFSKELCGKSRPGHFDGVLTVVMKLLNIIKPTRAYFGEKDYQQYKLIKNMSEAFFMEVEIISIPTCREKNGLALSSRNLLLTDNEISIAPKFYKYINSTLKDDEIEKQLDKDGFKVDYIQSIDNRRYGAVFLGNVRLIDNVEK